MKITGCIFKGYCASRWQTRDYCGLRQLSVAQRSDKYYVHLVAGQDHMYGMF